MDFSINSNRSCLMDAFEIGLTSSDKKKIQKDQSK